MAFQTDISELVKKAERKSIESQINLLNCATIIIAYKDAFLNQIAFPRNTGYESK